MRLTIASFRLIEFLGRACYSPRCPRRRNLGRAGNRALLGSGAAIIGPLMGGG